MANPKDSAVHVELDIDGSAANLEVEIKAFYQKKEVGTETFHVHGNHAQGAVTLSEVHLWERASRKYMTSKFL